MRNPEGLDRGSPGAALSSAFANLSFGSDDGSDSAFSRIYQNPHNRHNNTLSTSVSSSSFRFGKLQVKDSK
jgi:hypothetical protein